MTRIKICGITRSSDAEAAQRSGADALGFVFVAASKRAVEIEQAAAIAAALNPFVTRVALFLDPERELVEQVLAAMPSAMPQFHGREEPDFCDSFNRPYLKAIGVGSGLPDAATLSAYRQCCGFLFDSNAAGELGGTGHTFDWSLFERAQALLSAITPAPALILAGGLDPDNVALAVERLQPDAVDVSTGVEESPGIKNSAAMRAFVNAVRAATP